MTPAHTWPDMDDRNALLEEDRAMSEGVSQRARVALERVDGEYAYLNERAFGAGSEPFVKIRTDYLSDLLNAFRDAREILADRPPPVPSGAEVERAALAKAVASLEDDMRHAGKRVWMPVHVDYLRLLLDASANAPRAVPAGEISHD